MRLYLFILCLYSTSGYAQDTNYIKPFKLYSTILKEERFFDIYFPPDSKNKLEVIYVLDGQAQFMNVVSTLKRLGQNDKIIVGIGNIWLRDRDYTPTHVNSLPFLDSGAANHSGGGQNFIFHLEKELIPYINDHYPTGTSRIIIGHSLGGLIAMDILLNHPDLFRKYVIIDPSMWWDDCSLLKQSGEILKKGFPQTYLFLAIANTMDKDKKNIDAIREDISQGTALIRPSLLLLDYLKVNSKNSIKLDWKFYKDENHISVFQPAVVDGLKFILKPN